MKDGTVYKGKIQIDNGKAILIGNPPFDPTSYLLKAEDIDKIIYEEYRPNPPAERKRGLTFESRLLSGKCVFVQINSVGTRARPLRGARVSRASDARTEWRHRLDSGHAFQQDAFSVSDGTTTRRYQDFWQYSAVFWPRLYPFLSEKMENGTLSHRRIQLGPSNSQRVSGDSLKGSGWLVGFGAIRPLTTHVFLEARFVYQKMSYDTIQFLGPGRHPSAFDRSARLYFFGWCFLSSLIC